MAELADDVFIYILGFLESMFPVSNDSVLHITVWTEISRCGGLYGGCRWREYPIGPPQHEKHLYKPFVELVESITRYIPVAQKNDVQ